MKKLTPKQGMFVKEYLIDLNATQAAIRAGYSEKTSYSIGEENLKKPEIAKAIDKAKEERSQIVDVTAQDVLQSIKFIRDSTVTAEKWGDALKANELLGKHLVLFTDKQEIGGVNGNPILTIERVIVGKTTDKDG